MKVWHLGVVGIVVAFFGCADDVQKVEPGSKGKRGETCRARNDCAGGLACVSGICTKNDFDIDVSAKHCDVYQCEEDVDCCGDKPLEAPARCADRVSICETPNILDCPSASLCDDDDECEGGTCVGFCTYGSATCTSDAECTANVCSAGYCSYTGTVCTADADCEETCSTKQCDCANPEFDPADELCTDPDCIDICTLTCEDRLCRPNTSCETDDECAGLATDICEDGKCVECVADDDCNEDDNEECVDNVCDKPCEVDEECPLFNVCDGGECEYVGCQSDRECVLAANGGPLRSGGSPDNEPRLAECLESDDDPDLKVCKVPCENDVECPSDFDLCVEGFCRFMGCDSDADCRAYLGLEGQELTEETPYFTTTECNE